MVNFYCSSCPYFTRFFYILLRHYTVEHQSEKNFKITCNLDGCIRTYEKVESFRHHVRRNHVEAYERFTSNTNHIVDNEGVIHDSQNLVDVDNTVDHNVLGQFGDDSDLENMEISPDQLSYDKAVTTLLLKLRETHMIAEKTAVDFVKGMQKLLDVCILDSKSSTNQIVPFENLKSSLEKNNTVYKQRKNIEAYGYVKPIEVFLDDDKIKDRVVYIPILDTSKMMLKHDEVLYQVLNPPEQQYELIDSYKSSHACRGNELFSKDEHALQMKLYMDDFQTVNPIGTKVNWNKICSFYFTLGNIPFHLQSKLHTIQLLLLTKSVTVDSYGYEKVLESFLRDMKILENDGITIETSDGDICLNGSISIIIADNLAAHQLGGYFESFSSFKACRFCDATKESRKISFVEGNFTLNTPASYDAKLVVIQENHELAPAYGLKRKCALNDLKYFHIS